MSRLRELRAIVPSRRLTNSEALVLAERQATTLLRLQGVDAAPVPSEVITELPFLRVARRSPMQSSGATSWIKPRWVILINRYEAASRQRFSLAHEFKHVLDHLDRSTIYGPADSRTAALRIERICDYFAACLLMPRTWVKTAFASGLQDVVALAEHFQVSPQAMQVRLLQIGLLDRYGRCGMNNAYLRSMTVSPLELAA